MAHTSYPCPACFQVQQVTHENGQAVESRLCASCQEEADALELAPEAFVALKHQHKGKPRSSG